jgi:hypothetical protein
MSNVHVDLASVEFHSVHSFERILRVAFLSESYETESTASPGVTVTNDCSVGDITVLCECILETVIVGIPTQSTNE